MLSQHKKWLPGNSKGFTLIELLVVIVVIGILIALTLPNLFAAQERARDTQRKNDLSNISQQLETYYNDNQTYPAGDGQASSVLTALTSDGYMDEIPTDPNGDSTYTYTATPTGCDGDVDSTPCAAYTLSVDLENENDADADDTGTYTEESINEAPETTTTS